MKPIIATAASLLVLGALPTIAFCQEAPAASSPATVATVAAASDKAGPGTPTSTVGPLDFIGALVSQDSSSITAKYSFKQKFDFLGVVSVNASVPVTTSASSLKLSTLDGMANGASLGLSTSNIRIPSLTGAYSAESVRDVCDDLWAEYAREGLTKPDRAQCFGNDIDKLTNAAAKSEFRERHQLAGYRGSVELWGFNAKVGYQDHTFYSSTNQQKSTSNNSPWSVGAYAAIEPDVFGRLQPALITLNYQYQDAYPDNKQKIDCPSVGASATTCVYGSINAPKLQIKDLVTLDFRYKPFSFFAFALTPTYDARSRLWSVDAPVYLIQDKNGLSGGLDFGWRSDTHASTVGVFFSKAFSLKS